MDVIENGLKFEGFTQKHPIAKDITTHITNSHHSGGFSLAASRVVDVLDAAGFDTVLIETVGAGQSEIDVVDVADLTVVVCAPGLGDDVQAMKAGLLEVADVLVVNKADDPLAADPPGSCDPCWRCARTRGGACRCWKA